MALSTRNLIAFLLISFLFVHSRSAEGQVWESRNSGMEGGTVNDLLVRENTILLSAGQSRVFRSEDNGVTWSQSSSGLDPVTSPHTTSFAVCSDTVFLGLRSAGVAFSVDDGLTWTYLSGTPSFGYSVYQLLAVGNTLFASTSQGLFRSTSRAQPWAAVGGGLPPNIGISIVFSHDNIVFAGLQENGLYRSEDFGETWTLVDDLPADVWVTAFLAANDRLIAGAYSGLYVSVDNGINWTKVGTGLYEADHIKSLTEMNGAIYAATLNGLFVSNDNGGHFSVVDIPEFPGYHSFDFISRVGDELFLNPAYRGIYRSTDGVTWTPSNSGLSANWALTLFKNKTRLYASVEAPEMTYKSDDMGQSWQEIKDGLSSFYRIVDLGDTLVGQRFGSGSVGISVDDGQNWTFPPYELEFASPGLVHSEDTLFCLATANGLYLNRGENQWQTLIETTEARNFVDVFSIGDTLVARMAGDEYYVSANRGVDWDTRINSSLEGIQRYFLHRPQ